ncbi:MAG: GNAT family N-acetyltransferase, partial [Alphaproteobacteria bacterium]|nr:GNAT family N-acetyltransferase [Alphaproteobacteria bacterium]
MPRQASRPALHVRQAELADIPGIVALSGKVYLEMGAYSESMIQGQIINFPDGQVVVEYEDEIVGYAASFLIDEADALSPHTWSEITGNGYASRHNPRGEWLYGMEICVDPDRRRLRIGQRLYDARKELAERYELKGIVFGGRMPNWRRRRKQYASPQAYLEAVMAQEVSDPVIRFQTRMGYEPLGVLKGYMPDDRESGGYATHMVWR